MKNAWLGLFLVTAAVTAFSQPKKTTRDGFVIGNGDGILGAVSGATSTPRAFATDMIAINTIAVSSDGRCIAAGNSFGEVEVWELR
jgi:tricorn protease-like protein